MILRFGKKKIEEMESRAQQALACLNALEQKVEKIEKATDCLCEQMQNLQQELKDITELMNHAVQTQASDTDRLYQIMEVQAQKLTVLDEKQNTAHEKTENVALCLQGVAEKARQMAENQEKNKDMLISLAQKQASDTDKLYHMMEAQTQKLALYEESAKGMEKKLTVLDEKQNTAHEKTEKVALCLQGVVEKARQMAENQEKNKDILLSVTEKLAGNIEALDAVKAESTLMRDTMNIMEKETRMLLLNSVMDQMP